MSTSHIHDSYIKKAGSIATPLEVGGHLELAFEPIKHTNADLF